MTRRLPAAAALSGGAGRGAAGPLMAAAGTWEAIITGVGGHAAAGIGVAVVRAAACPHC